MLESIGWKAIVYKEKDLAIIYNTKVLEPEGDSTKELPYEHKDGTKYVLLLQTFNMNNSKISLGTIHAQYSVDYSTSIPEIIDSAGMDIIIGGDMNHPPGYKFPGTLTASTFCTNFYTDYHSHESGFKEVWLTDKYQENRVKNYDGFLTNIKDVSVRGESYIDKIVDFDGNGIELPIIKHVTIVSSFYYNH